MIPAPSTGEAIRREIFLAEIDEEIARVNRQLDIARASREQVSIRIEKLDGQKCRLMHCRAHAMRLPVTPTEE